MERPSLFVSTHFHDSGSLLRGYERPPLPARNRSQDTRRPNPTTVGLSWAKKGKMARTVVQAAPHLGWIREVAALMREARASPRESNGAGQGKRLLQRLFQSWGQWQHRNALFQQLQRLIKVCLSANGALIRFTPMHFAGFFGEAFAHILRLGNGLPHPLQPRRSLRSV